MLYWPLSHQGQLSVTCHFGMETRPTMDQIMACSLFDAKPLPEPLLIYCPFLPEASFGLRVLSSPASVGLCVCVYQSRACPHDNSSPIQARITKFGPEMQNTLVWVPIVLGDDRSWSSRSNLTWKSNLTPFWACSHHYSSAIQARITKFGPKMHLSTVKIPTNFGFDWFWSSLSFSILKPIFLPNLFASFLYIFSETRRL